ncbi:MAG TPA: BNR-4 repeat-containing protein [Candidatus Limnocylindrales bacterium]|nr:BNR-4 repeat-containing protein [Candidatus Limnocylindrales bacterium]
MTSKELRTGCFHAAVVVLLGHLLGVSALAQPIKETNYVAGQSIELSDNGAWSWFMDERAIVDRGRLLVGSVRANGKFENADQPGWGNVELSILDLRTKNVSRVILHRHFEQDDHNAPGLLVLHDGRYLAAYSKHNQEPRFWFRISTHPGDPSTWEPAVETVTPGVKGNWSGDNFTYCNPMMLSGENNRIYLFHRGVSQDPNYLFSDDDGRHWTYGGKLFDGRHGYSPYTKYACDGKATIHFVATEDHPRNFDNSLYHGFIRADAVCLSDGRRAFDLSHTTNTSIRPWNLTKIYQGGPSNVAWMCDIELDTSANPVVLFTVQVDGAGLPKGQGGMDHRFHYARWDGKAWHEAEIAYAGTRLYAGEDDYTGLGSVHPKHPETVYISTDADPVTGKPLVSVADGQRHHELFRGLTSDDGKSWRWFAITANSTMDNLRPLVPAWNDSRTVVIWLRGGYRNNRGEWTTSVEALLVP